MARIITVHFGRVGEYNPPHPERTAYRFGLNALDGDVRFREWPSRGAMLTSLRMQRQRAARGDDWIDWQASRWAIARDRARDEGDTK